MTRHDDRESHPLARCLRLALNQPSPRADDHEIERGLVRLLAESRRRWPQVQVDDENFITHLAQRLEPGDDLAAALGRLHGADLYLACACSAGNPQAIAALDRHYLHPLQHGLASAALPPATVEEALQQLRQRLLVAEGDGAPLIARYAGRGQLSSWTRVTALRLALRLERRQGRDQPADDRVLEALPAGGDDPELGYIKGLYRRAFREAFAQALQQLSDRQRALLQLHYVDAMTTYEVAALYRVSQATASRWLTRARQQLIAGIRARLTAELAIDHGELDSILRLIDSRLEVTLRGLASD
jgi:RNA polymerase sigma-70 factor (ECF subfamily)